jgi:hypothetical protein
LPSNFAVLAPDGSLLPMHGFPARALAASAKPLRATSVGGIQARTTALKAAIAMLNPSGGAPVDAEMVRQVHDTVWWRRVAYFACLFSTLCVVAFPYASGIYARLAKAVIGSIPWIGTRALDGVIAWARWFTLVWHGWTTGLMQAIGTVVPSYSKAWLDALAEQPLEMLLALALVALFFGAGRFLAQRIHDRAWFAWHSSRRGDYIVWAVESATSSRNKGLVFAVVSAVTFAGSLIGGASPATVGTMFLLTLLTIAATIWRFAILGGIRRDRAAIENGAQALPSTPTLKVARFLRCSAPLVRVYRLVSDRLIPLVFAGVLAFVCVGAAYHLVLRVGSSAGWFCTAAASNQATPHRDFDTTQICWDSGTQVSKGHSYEVRLTTTGNWFDQTIPANAAGISSPSGLHVLAQPMKRFWSAHWFQPIVRVGVYGDDEHVMVAVRADDKVATARFTADRDAQLFLYVNDAILLLPQLSTYFYQNNHGTGTLSVCELQGPPGGDLAEKTCPSRESAK